MTAIEFENILLPEAYRDMENVAKSSLLSDFKLSSE